MGPHPADLQKDADQPGVFGVVPALVMRYYLRLRAFSAL